MRLTSCYVFILLYISVNLSYASNVNSEFLEDIHHYCQYITDKNMAKKALLLAPDLILRAQNTVNDYDYPYQNNFVSALSKNLSDIAKSRHIKQLIDSECHYYQLTQEAALQVQFALTNAQGEALAFKLKQIRLTKNKLHYLLKTNQKKLISQHETLANLYQIELSLQHLESTEQEIYANLATRQSVFIKPVKLSQLLDDLRQIERTRRSTINALEKLDNWSIQVQAGAQQNLSSFVHAHHHKVQPYAALIVRYNTGALVSHHRMDRSLNRYSDWKENQLNGTQKKLTRLITAILDLDRIEKKHLAHLKVVYKKQAKLITQVHHINSDKARHFKQKINFDQTMMAIEITYLDYFIHCLNKLV